MIYQRKKLVKTIMSPDPTIFDRDFNAFIQRVLDSGCEYEVHHCDGMNGVLCCQIFYTSTVEIPEDEIEDHMLCGDSKRCADCPIWAEMRASDPRGQKKYYRCSRGEGRAYAEREACNWFYQQEGGKNEG